MTNTDIVGFKVPKYKEAVKLALKASKVVKEIRYVGWDVAITNDGPCIIEGNEFPSYGLIQNYLLDKDNPGHLKQIKDVIGDEIKNIKL